MIPKSGYRFSTRSCANEKAQPAASRASRALSFCSASCSRSAFEALDGPMTWTSIAVAASIAATLTTEPTTVCSKYTSRASSSAIRSSLDHHVVVLNAHAERLGQIWPFDQLGALLHRHAEAARLHLLGIAPRLAGADVELPGM